MSEPREIFVTWLLLEGDRRAVIAALLAGILLLLVGSGYAGVTTVDDPAAIRGIAGGMIPGLFTFLSIVLAINQLVLSQEYGSADEVRTRVQEIREFRQDVEDMTTTAPSPVVPTDFLSLVVQTVDAKAEALGKSVPPGLDTEARESIHALVDTIRTEARRANDEIDQRDQGRVNALLPVLQYSYATQLYEVRRLQNEYSDELPESTDRVLTDLIEVLELFSVARTHFRTTYTQRVLAQLSRMLLVVGVPALLAAVILHLLAVPSGLLFLDRYRLVVVSVLLTVAFSPLAVLFAYLLRVATISERTIAVGPFVSRPSDARET